MNFSKPKHKRNLIKIIPFSIIWGLTAILYSIIEYGILGDSDIYPSTNNAYQPLNSIIINIPSSLALGFLIGVVEVYLLKGLFSGKSFWKKILFKTLLYLVAISFFLIITSFALNSLELRLPVFHPKVIQSIQQFVGNFVFLSIIIFCGFMAMLSLFVAEVSNYLGGTIFNKFFVGKYHKPIEEKRIFMFLDMKASTTIAEELGHIQYFKLLNQYYDVMSDAIMNYQGEVYQYIGDEVVVTWEFEKGKRETNCLQCFFALKESMHNQADKFQINFGVAPDFKAGMHLGEVTTGEIGALKKEIVFTGDVLNTTARIQGLCKEYQTDLIISEELMNSMSAKDNFQFTPLGELSLRGKSKLVNLFSVVNIT